MSRFKDYTGTMFGRLLCIERCDNGRTYRCQCACGNQRIVDRGNLTAGTSRSCGCLRVEACKERERKKNHPTHGVILSYYKKNAKDRARSWELLRNEFTALVTGNCHYCGAEPTAKTYNGKVIETNGIDRVDNSIGYRFDNCVTACTACNTSKLNRTKEEFLVWAKKVVDYNAALLLH